MAAFTINSGAVTSWDSLSGGSTNATLDSYTISAGSTLLIDTDSYQCAGHSTAFGSLDTVAYTGIGGTLRIDGTAVRVIPFNTGTGTVPAIGTSIAQGGVSGPLLGVWSGWQSEPIAAGAAMPASGYIKIKSVTGGAFAAGALTGISASATGPDVVGWIEVRGADTASITVPRVGRFETVGDWFELGTTTGVRGQVLPCPTTGTVASVFPGVWIETANGSGVFERFVGCGAMVNSATTPTDARGKIVWQTTSGIRIGSDGTNNVGFLPPAGCRVRIPNVILTCCTRTISGSGPRVSPSTTLATRQEFVTTAAGSIDLSNAVCAWYLNMAQAYQADFAHSAICDTIVISEVAAPLAWDDVIVAPTGSLLSIALNLSSHLTGGQIDNSTFARFSMATSGANPVQCANSAGVNFSGCRAMGLLNRANGSAYPVSLSNCVDFSLVGMETINGGINLAAGCQRVEITNQVYADLFSGATGTANAASCVSIAAGTADITVDGITMLPGATNVHPYTALVFPAGVSRLKFRNVGSPTAPLSLGSANQTGLIISSNGLNADCKFQRLYCSNTRLSAWSFLNSDTRMLVEHVRGDDADSSVLVSLNSTHRGNRLASATTAQTSVYGTHWHLHFTSDTAGFLSIACNEPTAETSGECYASGGTPRFNSQGQVLLTTIGDQVTWETPWQVLGCTALANSALALVGTNTGNVTYEFQHDTGAGWSGTWQTANGANLSALSISPSAGFRLRLRATCAVASATNALTNIRIALTTTASAQADNRYPLDTNTVTFTGLPVGTDVVVLSAGTSTILAQQDSHGSSSYGYTYSGAQTVDVGFIKPGFVPLYIRNLALGTADSSIPVAMTADRNFI